MADWLQLLGSFIIGFFLGQWLEHEENPKTKEEKL